MQVIPARFSAHTFAIFRIVAGLLFLMHGTQKLFGWPGGKPPVALSSMMGIAGIIELVCGVMIMIGLFGGIAAFIASGEMAAAYFMAHASRGSWPILNQGELAVLFCFAFLYVAAHGSGIWSVDAARGRSGSFVQHTNTRRAA